MQFVFCISGCDWLSDLWMHFVFADPTSRSPLPPEACCARHITSAQIHFAHKSAFSTEKGVFPAEFPCLALLCESGPAAMASESACALVADDQTPLQRRPSAPRRRSKVGPSMLEKDSSEYIPDSARVSSDGAFVGLLLPAETSVRVRFTSNERDTDPQTGRPYTLYTAEIQTPLSSWTKDCRFKQLSDVNRSLQQTLGRAAPNFPRKPGLFGANLQSDFIQQRQKELNDWISKVFFIPASLNDRSLLELFESERGDLAIHVELSRSRATTAALQQQLHHSEAHSAKLVAQLDAVHTTLFQFRLRLARLEAAVGSSAGLPELELSTTARGAQGGQPLSHEFALRQPTTPMDQRTSVHKSFSAPQHGAAEEEAAAVEAGHQQRSYTFPAPFRATHFTESFVGDDPLQGCSPGVAWLLGGPDARPPARSVKALNLPGPADAVDFVHFASTASKSDASLSHQIVLDSSSGVRVNMGAQLPAAAGTPAAQQQQQHSSLQWANQCIEQLILAVTPSPKQYGSRSRVVSFVQQLVQFGLGLECLAVGSAAAGSDLLESDVDLTFVTGPNIDSRSALDALSSGLSALAHGTPLAQAVQQMRGWPVQLRGGVPDASKQQAPEASDLLAPKWAIGASGHAAGAAAGSGLTPAAFRHVFAGGPQGGAATTAAASPDTLPQVTKVSLVVAATPLVKVVADGVSLDVSGNSLHSVAAALLVQLADEWVGSDTLFTRSLRLIKAVLLYQVPFLLPGLQQSICSAEQGTFNSWTLTVLLLALFNSHPIPIRSPLAALMLFIEEYHNFPFGTHVVTLHGPLHLFNLTRSRPAVQPRFVTDARLFPLRQLASRQDNTKNYPSTFNIGIVNVQDPVAPFSNTASAVSREGVGLIQQALARLRGCSHSLAGTLHSSHHDDSAPTAAATSALEEMVGGVFSKCADHVCCEEQPADWAAFAGRRVKAVPQAPRTEAASLSTSLKEAQFAYMLSKQQPLASVLLGSAAGILSQCGPMSVGQLGRLLQDACCGAISAAQLKSKFGGLRQLLQTKPQMFQLLDDHQFNPTCSLKLG